MEKNKNFRVVILSQEEDKINTLKGLLSKYYLLNITKICRHEAEAIEYLNNHKVSLFFLDMELSPILLDIQKPPFIVGICDKKHAKTVKKYLKMGFFEFFYTPFTERELNGIMGKVMNIYGSYNTIDHQLAQRMEEENLKYNEEDPAQKSIFIQGTRYEESIRIYFDSVLYIKNVKKEQVCVYFKEGYRKYFHSNLKMFHTKFPKSKFQKINRTVVVNMDNVTGVMKNRILIADNSSFELTRTYKKAFIESMPK